ncbi:hypothetical protein [Halorussus ruber]|uniref:hypothetical protein n=1 Tax=Halorussus ruber TaxID=1126238 RepID=UPI0010928946|nr:hypothetical protein [Halorussus ruber]
MSDEITLAPLRISPAPYVPGHSGEIRSEHSYSRLSLPDRLELHAELVEKHGIEQVQRLLDLLECWKETSKPRKETQDYERLVRETLAHPVEIRTLDGQQDRSDSPSTPMKALYGKYHELSREFFGEQDKTTVRVHRAVRKKAVAELFAQALDDPDRKEFFFRTTVVSNHSTVKQIGAEYSDGVVLRWEATLDEVAAAVDFLRPGNVPSEAEVHLLGGTRKLDASAVRHAGTESRFEVPLTRMTDRMGSPSQMELVDHREVANLLKHMVEHGTRVATEAGSRRLQTWWDTAEEAGAFDAADEDRVRKMVSYVSSTNPDAYWA